MGLLMVTCLAGEGCSSFFSERHARWELCSHTILAFASSRDSTDDGISLNPSKYLPLISEYFTSVTSLPSACAASASVERWEPINFTNQRLIMIVFMIWFIPLPACVVGTTPGDQEFTVIALPIRRSLRSNS